MGNQLQIDVNGVPHQMHQSAASAPGRPVYEVARPPRLDDVLVIGAGGGNDVAIALEKGAKRVDAVEIDPRIYDLGKSHHPDHPYQDPRVHVHIDDGRAFLERTSRHFDLIVLALPDSITLVSGQSSLRLESYLFTREALTSARDRLKPSGVFTMYNYYRFPWLIDRYADLFFMGAAFLLLETKNVVQFALLFGTTWFVNALVFAGVLLSVLLAVAVSKRVAFRRPERLYLVLLAALVVAFVLPPSWLLDLPLVPRFVAAVAVAFAPIFTANLVLTQRFKDTGDSTTAFGANLLGSIAGGVLEYSALIVVLPHAPGHRCSARRLGVRVRPPTLEGPGHPNRIRSAPLTLLRPLSRSACRGAARRWPRRRAGGPTRSSSRR